MKWLRRRFEKWIFDWLDALDMLEPIGEDEHITYKVVLDENCPPGVVYFLNPAYILHEPAG